MAKTALLLLLFSILMVFSSCETSDEISESNLGKYKLISLESNIPLDLNYDNVVSTDFKSELSIFYKSWRKPDVDLEFFPDSNNRSIWFFWLNTPKDNYHPDKEILELRYSVADYSKILIVKNNQIEKIVLQYSDIFNADEDWLIENRYHVPYEVVFDTAKKVTIRLRQKFFDLETESWVLVDLICVFEKFE